MTTKQATVIVLNCIRVVSNFSGTIKPQDNLKTLGIKTATLILSLQNRICTDSNIGVPSVNHQLDPAYLVSINADTQVNALISIVFNNSVTGIRRPLLTRIDKEINQIEISNKTN